MDKMIEVVRVLRMQEWTGTRAAVAAQMSRSLPDGEQWVNRRGARIGSGKARYYSQGDLLMTTTTLQPWGGTIVYEVPATLPVENRELAVVQQQQEGAITLAEMMNKLLAMHAETKEGSAEVAEWLNSLQHPIEEAI